jgi:hypothetical protein
MGGILARCGQNYGKACRCYSISHESERAFMALQEPRRLPRDRSGWPGSGQATPIFSSSAHLVRQADNSLSICAILVCKTLI